MAKREKLEPETKPKKPPKVWKRTHEFVPHFCFRSYEHAERVRLENAKGAGIHPAALAVQEQDGRFAVVPAWRKGMPIPQFKKGDIVYGFYRCDSEAKVVDAGPQQSVVRYLKESTVKGRPKEECVPNQYLFARSAETAPKRERL